MILISFALEDTAMLKVLVYDFDISPTFSLRRKNLLFWAADLKVLPTLHFLVKNHLIKVEDKCDGSNALFYAITKEWEPAVALMRDFLPNEKRHKVDQKGHGFLWYLPKVKEKSLRSTFERIICDDKLDKFVQNFHRKVKEGASIDEQKKMLKIHNEMLEKIRAQMFLDSFGQVAPEVFSEILSIYMSEYSYDWGYLNTSKLPEKNLQIWEDRKVFFECQRERERGT